MIDITEKEKPEYFPAFTVRCSAYAAVLEASIEGNCFLYLNATD